MSSSGNPSNPAAPTASLSASPATVTSGNHATLTWTTTNATSVSIDQGVGAVAASGSTTVSPTKTTQYTLTATGDGGTVTATATVTVQTAAPTATLTASPTTITGGASSTLTWTTKNATTVSINQNIGVVSASGSTVVMPTSTTQYTLTATDSGGATATASATVTVQTQGATNSPITHLVILMMQNHSFDNLFGTFPGANGLNPSLPSYNQVDAQGNTVSPTPITALDVADLNHDYTSYTSSWDNGLMDKFAFTNTDTAMQYYDPSLTGKASDGKSYGIGTLWNYAQQYALADNFFTPSMYSEPAQELYMVSATQDSTLTAGSLPLYDNCSAMIQKKEGGGSTIAPALAETNVGDQLSAAQVSWTFFQTNYNTPVNGVACADYVPQEDPFQYFTTTANSTHIQSFTMASFQSLLASGASPAVSWITTDGAYDMHPGGGNIMNGIEFIDNIVQAVKASSAWQSTAIIVLFDESGGWYDHVAPPQLATPAHTHGLGMRVPVIIISPYAKTDYISHQQMDFVSILRFIQWNWNLGMIPNSSPIYPQETREQQSGDICDLLTSPCGAPTAPPAAP